MKDLIEYIAKSIVQKPDEVVVTELEDEDQTVIQLEVAAEDKGKVIGRRGSVVQAIRSLLRIAAVKQNKRVRLDIS